MILVFSQYFYGFSKAVSRSAGLYVQPLCRPHIYLMIGSESVFILYRLYFLNTESVAVPYYGTAVSRVVEVFEYTYNVAGALCQYVFQAPDAARGKEAFQVCL